jgi:uncharacterized membrane protein YqiK
MMILANIQALLVARTVILALGAVLSLFLVPMLLGMRYILSNRVGIVERLWSLYGSIREGRLMAMAGQAGYQSAVLRGGFRFLLGWCQCQIHSLPLAVIPQDKTGYVFARDGEPLKAEQSLARVVPCDNFQDAMAFLAGGHNPLALCGQRGRQRAILREGVFTLNQPQPGR